ncbi:MAG: FAD-dependent oxidoreductase, partial [Burkholderiaceae bacterium]
YQLTESDVLGCASFDDSIGVNGWPLELHLKGDVEFRWPPIPASRGFNQLPYRMLVPLAGAEPPQAGDAPSGGSAKRVGAPVTLDNLWVAGRCASMTHEAQSAARVTGACFVMGQAAGIAADLALKSDTTAAQVDTTALQGRLEAEGAWLGTHPM